MEILELIYEIKTLGSKKQYFTPFLKQDILVGASKSPFHALRMQIVCVSASRSHFRALRSATSSPTSNLGSGAFCHVFSAAKFVKFQRTKDVKPRRLISQRAHSLISWREDVLEKMNCGCTVDAPRNTRF